MKKISPYLNFPGVSEEAFNFYKSVFGGEFSSVVRFKDMPNEGVSLGTEDRDKIMHISLPLTKDDVLMASDILESLGQEFVPGNNVYLMVQADSKAEADKIFGALAAGGTVEMPMADQPWGDYYGSLADKFGVQWMVDYTYPKKS